MSPPVEFAFADPGRRTWLALNREGDAYHLVHPVDPEDIRVRDGLRRVAELVCECKGGRFRGTCYVVASCEALERAAQAERTAAWEARPDVLEDPFTLNRPRLDDVENWFDGPPGEVMEAFGK